MSVGLEWVSAIGLMLTQKLGLLNELLESWFHWSSKTWGQ